MVRDLDIHYSKGHRLSNNTTSKVKTQKTPAKDFSRPEELKAKDLKSALLRIEVSDFLELV